MVCKKAQSGCNISDAVAYFPLQYFHPSVIDVKLSLNPRKLVFKQLNMAYFDHYKHNNSENSESEKLRTLSK